MVIEKLLKHKLGIERFFAITQIVFEKKRAIGVEYTHNGTSHQVIANKEVILTAGTVGSAQLLLLSGVGPKEHLQQLKVG